MPSHPRERSQIARALAQQDSYEEGSRWQGESLAPVLYPVARASCSEL